MPATLEEEQMAKPKKRPTDERITLLNMKGSPEEKELLDAASEESGIPATTIARRGIAMWMSKNGYKIPPDWPGK